MESPLNLSKLYDVKTVASLRTQHDSSQPYTHVEIDELCNQSQMRLIHDEMLQMRANLKETDLFKVFQTNELATLDDAMKSKMPTLMALRTALYSAEFREFVTKITGCDALTERVVG